MGDTNKKRINLLGDWFNVTDCTVYSHLTGEGDNGVKYDLARYDFDLVSEDQESSQEDSIYIDYKVKNIKGDCDRYGEYGELTDKEIKSFLVYIRDHGLAKRPLPNFKTAQWSINGRKVKVGKPASTGRLVKSEGRSFDTLCHSLTYLSDLTHAKLSRVSVAEVASKIGLRYQEGIKITKSDIQLFSRIARALLYKSNFKDRKAYVYYGMILNDQYTIKKWNFTLIEADNKGQRYKQAILFIDYLDASFVATKPNNGRFSLSVSYQHAQSGKGRFKGVGYDRNGIKRLIVPYAEHVAGLYKDGIL